ncbi:ADP-ribose diphosphatase [Monocercomonoides exilis]|uniref:ADP-ribose diphosphatase n=1 Tax=Monocercomonoides exilis TaxID=2049356 RepID=UPI00355A019D|nr:ADP-ribose diphosphatase [Monocercomonoides exilis]|eukprot:MONOS_4530.1-p1 / transcript=MONOS_4530.1 / gene=MONOS_4530 / organism=Monocercomonoides_exilis_PA203 / gene_product=ADP-ribose diphosphatase [EC:3.6.1.13] / transcript_product=ADP-ribose diphosphatase [EC:3.6.1.13] / location=Mono_scaffold00121:82342-83428(-) / protein_length=254 / sequence_SO=supercontig / SO=protein_coding / is_pseudo=false
MYKQTFEPIGTGKWIEFGQTHFEDKSGKKMTWEMIRRIGCNDKVQAVEIIPLLIKKDKDPQLILVKQYRAPCNSNTIEFPSGLVGSDETPESSAIRELWEETGYTAKLPAISVKEESKFHDESSSSTSSSSVPFVAEDTSAKDLQSMGRISKLRVPNPATSPTRMLMVTLYIDGDLPENDNPKTHCQIEEGEETHTILLTLDDQVTERLNRLSDEEHTVVESRVGTFIEGFVASRVLLQMTKEPCLCINEKKD